MHNKHLFQCHLYGTFAYLFLRVFCLLVLIGNHKNVSRNVAVFANDIDSSDNCILADNDPSLQPMEYIDITGRKQVFEAYMPSNLSTSDQMSHADPTASNRPPVIEPAFPGRIGKFINLSNESVRLSVL